MFNISKTVRSTVVGALAFAAVAGATAGSAMADRYDRHVTFVNHYDASLMYLYATHVDQTSWGYDHLGQYVVDPGYEITVNLNDYSGYCRFDILAEFADGSTETYWGVNVCEVGEVTYY
jgi:hypothetical protein